MKRKRRSFLFRSLTNLTQTRHLDTREKLQLELEEIKEHLNRRDEENKVSGSEYSLNLLHSKLH